MTRWQVTGRVYSSVVLGLFPCRGRRIEVAPGFSQALIFLPLLLEGMVSLQRCESPFDLAQIPHFFRPIRNFRRDGTERAGCDGLDRHTRHRDQQKNI